MLIKRQIFVILLAAVLASTYSQEPGINKISINTILAEFSINQDINFYSILYDRLLNDKGTVNFGIQTGLTISTTVITGAKGYSIFYPLKGYLLVGKSSHKLEAGIGIKAFETVLPDYNIGYRYKANDNGLCFRAGYNGIVHPGGLNNLLSMSVGYTF